MKRKPTRLKPIRVAAVHAHCMECGRDGQSGDVVLAHLPYHDAGMGQKCSDLSAAYLCYRCHAYCDDEGRADWEFRFRVLRKQIEYLFDEKLLR